MMIFYKYKVTTINVFFKNTGIKTTDVHYLMKSNLISVKEAKFQNERTIEMSINACYQLPDPIHCMFVNNVATQTIHNNLRIWPLSTYIAWKRNIKQAVLAVHRFTA